VAIAEHLQGRIVEAVALASVQIQPADGARENGRVARHPHRGLKDAQSGLRLQSQGDVHRVVRGYVLHDLRVGRRNQSLQYGVQVERPALRAVLQPVVDQAHQIPRRPLHPGIVRLQLLALVTRAPVGGNPRLLAGPRRRDGQEQADAPGQRAVRLIQLR